MHRGHEHHHDSPDGAAAQTAAPGAGHNHAQARQPVQWQTPHRPDEERVEHDPHGEKDLDLVEAAFVEGFLHCTDQTSFLRLAQVAFKGTASDGAGLVLLRVAVESVADVGSVTPHLGGGTFRYDPLPQKLVSRRQRLQFVYFDGQGLRHLTLGEARAITSA